MKKILVISGGIWPPAVEMAGTSAIYQIIKRFGLRSDFEVHVLTSLASWTNPDLDSWSRLQRQKYNLTFHFIKTTLFESQPFINLTLTRLLFFLKAVKLNSKFDFSLIHDYSSLPALIGFTGLLGKICHAKSIHTLSTASSNIFSSSKFIFGLNWIDKVIVTSKKIKQDLIKNKSNLIEKISYIPLGVDTEKFKPCHKNTSLLKKFNLPKGNQIILFLGPLDKRKGSFILAKAINRVIKTCPKTMFLFASYGTEGRDLNYYQNRKKLRKLLVKARNNVKLLEGKQKVPQLMSVADIFVLPNTSSHGTLVQPLTLLEAMSAGKTCLVSDLQKGDGLTENGVNCLLFKSGDKADLAKKIIFLLSNKQLARSFAREARKKIVAEFAIDKIIKKVYSIYSK